jgi:tetratricopeptide (TPR) repeat protein
MSSRQPFVLALLLTILAAVGAWRMGWLATVPAPVAGAPRPSPPPRFQSAWATEQEWLVDRITRDIREMGALAAGRPLPPADAPAVKPGEIRFEEYLFSPRSYGPLARQALGGSETASARGSSRPREDARLLSALLTPKAGVLVREDVALSSALEGEPRDPGAHERAALLLGAFALRDCAGSSTDTRPALTRLTAHLALARALRGAAEPGLAGRFAEAVLVTLVGREKDALARLDSLDSGAASPAEKAWVRALRLRNTGDWRIARDEKGLTLLETLEEFRALVLGQDDAAALEWLARREPQSMPDWGRLALSSMSPSMGTFNRFADVSLAMDMGEAAEVLRLLHAAPADEAGFFDALNEEPGGSIRRDKDGRARIAVIGKELWASRFQRNVVFDLETGHRRRWSLGLPGERKAFAEQSRESFGRLAMFPIVMRAQADDAGSYGVAMAAVREMALRSPERLTAGHWQLIRRKEDFAAVPRDLPDPNAWFHPALPPGTLLDLGPRLELAELAAIPTAEFGALREQAPYNVALALRASHRQPIAKRSVADLVAVFGPLAEFHLYLMSKLADAAWYDPPEFRRRQEALCELSPDYCLGLGYRLAELGFDDEAAVAYQKAFDRARDAVAVANNSRWLVDYYFDHGQRAKAEAVARQAAETYSGSGLFTMARLQERMGRVNEAEEYYRRILDRYGDAGPLAGFYYRQVHELKNTAYEAKLKNATALALPTGLERFDRSSLPPAPTDGVVFKGANDNTKRYGIQLGNVIVGLDGFRVRNYEAYALVKELSQSPRMKFVIWRRNSYDDVEVELWDRRFRVDIDTFTPAK